jgi:peroxiredoxin
VASHYADFRALGAEVVAVTFQPPAQAAAFLAREALPFPLLCDPQRQTYQLLAAGRTSWRGLLRLGILARYLSWIIKGWWPRKINKGEDIFQLGGDFVLDAQGQLVFAHRSADPTDRPSWQELLEAARQAAARQQAPASPAP